MSFGSPPLLLHNTCWKPSLVPMMTHWFASSDLHLLKLSREVPKNRRRFDDSEAAQLVAAHEDFRHSFDDVVDMALSVDPARNGKADKLHRGT